MPRAARPTRFRGKWRIRWIDDHGRRQSAVFDSHRAAEHELRARKTEVEEVRRGQRAATAPEKTVDDALDYWIAKRAPLKRSGRNDESIIRKHLRPAFHGVRLRDLTVAHVDTYVAERSPLDPKTLNNHLTLFTSILNVAVDLGWLAKVPRVQKPRVRISVSENGIDWSRLGAPVMGRPRLPAINKGDEPRWRSACASARIEGASPAWIKGTTP